MAQYKSVNGVWLPINEGAKQTDFTKNLQNDNILDKKFKVVPRDKKKEKKDA